MPTPLVCQFAAWPWVRCRYAGPATDPLIPSPITHTPCCFYQVKIEHYKSDIRGGGSGTHYRTDMDGARFYLQDQSGKVLIDSYSASPPRIVDSAHIGPAQ